MPPRISVAKLQTVIELLERKTPVKEIVERAQVSKTTVYDIRHSLKLCGSPYPATNGTIGRPKTFTDDEELSLLSYLDDHPNATLDEMIDYMVMELGVECELHNVYAVLKRRGWSIREARKRHQEQNLEQATSQDLRPERQAQRARRSASSTAS